MRAWKWRLMAGSIAMVTLASAYYRWETVPLMSETANAFLASLEPEQRAKVVFPMEDEGRLFWHYIPSPDIEKRFGHPRQGLTLREMTPTQKHLASALLSAGLSRSGYVKATTVMSLEEVLKVMEKDSGARRDPDKYHFSIFGQPSEKGIWGYRVEGHHVSVHFTVANGKLATSPTFFGANPAEVREGPRKGLRALAREEDLARDLLGSLAPEQQKIAIVSPKAYADILTAAERKAALEGQPTGLSAAKLKAQQRQMLDALVAEYAQNVPAEVAEHRMRQLKDAGNNVYFAWAGVTERGGPHYYRVQTPSFLIEYDNTQNDANHIHSVWRDYKGDFGLDLLAEHYQKSH
jgi:hypothetical protein